MRLAERVANCRNRVNAEHVVDRGCDICRRYRVAGGIGGVRVAGAINRAGWQTGAGHEHGVTVRPVIAAALVGAGC